MTGLHMLRDTALITLTATQAGTYGDTVTNPAGGTLITTPCFIEWTSSREGLIDGIEQANRRARVVFPLRTTAGTVLNITPQATVQLTQGGQDIGTWRVTDKGSNDFPQAGVQVCECERLDSDG